MPAPEIPDFASTMMSRARHQQARLGERQQREQRGGRVTARIRKQPRGLDGVQLELGEAVGHAGGQVAGGRVPLDRASSARSRNAPERSTTRAPAASNWGARSADAASGSARKMVSAAATSPATSSGTTSPSQMRARPGRRLGVLVACDPVASVSDAVGMAGEQPDQLLPGIAGRPGDARPKSRYAPFGLLRLPPSSSRLPCVPRRRDCYRSAERKSMRQREYLYIAAWWLSTRNL